MILHIMWMGANGEQVCSYPFPFWVPFLALSLSPTFISQHPASFTVSAWWMWVMQINESVEMMIKSAPAAWSHILFTFWHLLFWNPLVRYFTFSQSQLLCSHCCSNHLSESWTSLTRWSLTASYLSLHWKPLTFCPEDSLTLKIGMHCAHSLKV